MTSWAWSCPRCSIIWTPDYGGPRCERCGEVTSRKYRGPLLDDVTFDWHPEGWLAVDEDETGPDAQTVMFSDEIDG